MGSSKKHKEKREHKKKHKKDRLKDKDGHKKSRKSSHRREKHKSSDSDIDTPHNRHISGERDISTEVIKHEIAKPSTSFQTVVVSEDEFDVDKLLDSKLSEVADISSSKHSSKKRKRVEAIEELKKRQHLATNEDSLEKFANEQLLEDHGVADAGSGKRSHSSAATSFQRFKVKEEPSEEDRGFNEPQLTLTIAETNKLRAKLGLKPLDDGKEHISVKKEEKEISEAAEKLREKLGLKVPEVQLTSEPDPEEAEANKLRVKLGLTSSHIEPEIPEPSESHQHVESLSIAETNKLRAKLGLKPLDVGGGTPGLVEGEKDVFKAAPEVFVKTENIREKKKTEDLREKLRVIKEKRQIEEKLKKTKGIADSDSEDESAASWVKKHQKILTEKEAAEKRAKLLEEMDAEFGIGALVEEEFDKKKSYTSKDLKGLAIAHDQESFVEGHQVILTLKDKGVLEEEDDVLENVNIVDNERYAKNVENKKKKPDYKPYEEPEYDEFGILKKRNMLSKYDEEIEGAKKPTFKIGTISNVPQMSREQELELIRMRLKQQNVMTLEMPEMKMANEYLTTDEMVQFKKPKKKKKVKKLGILKADDLIPENTGDNNFGSRRRPRRRQLDEEDENDSVFNPNPTTGIPLIEEDGDVKPEIRDAVEEVKVEKELNSALSKAKKLKERKIMASAPEKVMEILNSVNGGPSSSQDAKNVANIEMNSVAEFCRTLGDIPTYGQSGNRDEEAEDMMDLERDLLEERQKHELDAQNQGAWNEVDIEEKPAEIMMRENEPILEEEPDISLGVAGALKLATKKGYLDKEDQKLSSSLRASQLQAQSYTIEEKFYEDDKFGKRDRYTGPVQDFKEKNNYKPDVKLEYIDDGGRLLTSKEAFRYLSHKFHGKGPGKNKVDKRMKKLDQDTRLKQMSSTDTPLNTVKLLQLKQKETQSPYIVLSGGNKTLTQTMISKTKH